MYLEFYGLKEKPFQISADPKFLWLGEKHKEALATLKYGIVENKGFLLLTGDVGTGKTTLINALVNSFGDDVVVATVPDPGLSVLDFFNLIGNSFNIKKTFTNKGSFLVTVSHFLHKAHTNKKKVLLIIDEAQRLKQATLEEVRLLSNIERQDTKLINIFFVGQNEFNDILLDNKNRALRQRITVNYNIVPLTTEETGEYVLHRLRISGTEKKIFSKNAIKEIYAFSEGYPRLINIMCDRALLTGYVKETKKIKSAIIKECAQELRIKSYTCTPNGESLKTGIKNSQGAIQNILSRPLKKIAGYVGFLLVLSFFAGYLYSPIGYYGCVSIFKKIWGKEPQQTAALLPEKTSKMLHTSLAVPLAGKTTPSFQKDTSTETLIPAKDEKTLQYETKNSDSAGVARPDRKPNFSDQREDGIDLGAGRLEKDAAREPISIQNFIDKKTTVYFDYNSNELEPEAYESLNRLSTALVQHPEFSVVIKGYTDNSGRYVYNKKLSEFRANIVKSFFVGKGVRQSRIEAMGMGPVDPGATDDSGVNFKSNRRVEIEVKKAE